MNKTTQDASAFMEKHIGPAPKGEDALSERLRATFGDDVSTNTLKSGLVLYRLSGPATRGNLSEFWIDQACFTKLIREVQRAEELVEQYNPESYRRSKISEQLALLDDWGNKLTHRMKVTLKVPVTGYVGKVKFQVFEIDVVNRSTDKVLKAPLSSGTAQDARKRVDFKIGGLTQYVIPRFDPNKRIRLDDNPFAEGESTKLFKG